MDYGELVDDNYNPDHESFYINISNYFKNPVMTKIKNHGNQFSMWCCKIYSLLSNQYKYIIAVSPIDDFGAGATLSLSQIRWVNLQTRTLPENIKCIVHNYSPSYDTPLNKTIRRANVTKEASQYTCDAFPFITIDLLHNNKKDRNSYQNEGTIIAGLETYETILTLKQQ